VAHRRFKLIPSLARGLFLLEKTAVGANGPGPPVDGTAGPAHAGAGDIGPPLCFTPPTIAIRSKPPLGRRDDAPGTKSESRIFPSANFEAAWALLLQEPIRPHPPQQAQCKFQVTLSRGRLKTPPHAPPHLSRCLPRPGRRRPATRSTPFPGRKIPGPSDNPPFLPPRAARIVQASNGHARATAGLSLPIKKKGRPRIVHLDRICARLVDGNNGRVCLQALGGNETVMCPWSHSAIGLASPRRRPCPPPSRQTGGGPNRPLCGVTRPRPPPDRVRFFRVTG